MSVTLTVGDLEPERRLGRWAGTAAFASVAVTVGALGAATSSPTSKRTQFGGGRPFDSEIDKMQRLVDFHNTSTGQLMAVLLRSLGLLLSVAVGTYLYWLVRRRGAPVGRWALWSAVVGPVLVVGATVFGYFAFRDVADAYFASGPRSSERATRLIEESDWLSIAGVLDLLSRVVFAVWIGVLSAHAMKLGLFTRFLGYWGIGAAVALVVLPVGDAMYIGWLASMGFLAIGYWPGGRPEAWGNAPSPPS